MTRISIAALFLIASPVLADGGTVRPTGRVEPRKVRQPQIHQAHTKETKAQKKPNASGVANRMAGH